MLPPIFPPAYNIVKTYVRMYHKALSYHVSGQLLEQIDMDIFIKLEAPAASFILSTSSKI
jgi:hypothetical protein